MEERVRGIISGEQPGIKWENHERPQVRIVDIPVETRTGHFPDTSHKHPWGNFCLYTQKHKYACVFVLFFLVDYVYSWSGCEQGLYN
jgi:hypothetical protein